MRLVLFACLVFAAVNSAGLFWLAADEAPNEAYTALLAQPAHALQEPKANGYFLLLGFTAAPSLNPVQAGYEMWLEADRFHRPFDYTQASRSTLSLPEDVIQAISARPSPEVLTVQGRERLFQQTGSEEAILQARYQQWLAMPFEDWGYGHYGTIRFGEIFVAHRRYLADGHSDELPAVVERLEKDLSAWRTVLAQARTVNMKLMAAIMVDDDCALLAELLRQPGLAPSLLRRLSTLARPLSSSELSLQWPMQNEFVLGVQRYEMPEKEESPRAAEDAFSSEWIVRLARLQPDTLHKVAIIPPTSRVARFLHHKQRTLNAYARYYEAAIKAAEVRDGSLPKLSVVAQSPSRSLFASVSAPLLAPIDKVLVKTAEPVWEPALTVVREIDARLRLAGLQAKLRLPSPQPVSIRIAQAGTEFYDPFSGIPMLWNPVKGLLYSVGKDGLDDGGDRQLDITVAPFIPDGSQAMAPARLAQRSPL